MKTRGFLSVSLSIQAEWLSAVGLLPPPSATSSDNPWGQPLYLGSLLGLASALGAYVWSASLLARPWLLHHTPRIVERLRSPPSLFLPPTTPEAAGAPLARDIVGCSTTCPALSRTCAVRCPALQGSRLPAGPPEAAGVCCASGCRTVLWCAITRHCAMLRCDVRSPAEKRWLLLASAFVAARALLWALLLGSILCLVSLQTSLAHSAHCKYLASGLGLRV